jgi:DEAD/DEAH box helicase domain-containing protein
LVFDELVFRQAPEDLRKALFILTKVPGIEAWTAPPETLSSGFSTVARVRGTGQSVAWVTRSRSMGIPGESWGVESDEELIVGPAPQERDGWRRIENASLAKVPVAGPGATLVSVSTDFNGPTREFGQQFWKRLSDKCPMLSERIDSGTWDLVEVSYSDRYVKAPLPAILLLRVLTALKDALATHWKVTGVCLLTAPCDPTNHRRGNRVSDNWQDGNTRNAVLTEAFCSALSTGFELKTKPMQEVPHARTLTLEFKKPSSADATNLFRIWLDQGFGYWRTQEAGRGLPSRTDFNFSSGVPEQAAHLRQADLNIRGQEFPTAIATTAE